MKKLLALLVIISTFALVACSENADDIISKSIKATNGGDDKPVKTVTAEFTSATMGFDVNVKIYMSYPDKSRSDVSFMGRNISSIINGKMGWVKSDTILHPMSIDEVMDNKAGLETEMSFFTNELDNYKTKFLKVNMLDKDTLGGKKVFRIKCLTKDSIEKTFYIDPTSYLVQKTLMSIPGHKGKMNAETIYSDYKNMNGRMVPHTVVLNYDGKSAGKINIKSVEFNKPLGDDLFAEPKK